MWWLLWTAVGIALFLGILICFLVLALLHMRRDGKAMKGFENVIFAHRGLHNAERPENSAAAFEAAVREGFGIEFDLHLTRDGKLVVMHDGTTKRMCGESLKINGSSYEELRALSLPDGSKIPSFGEFLLLVDGRVPLLIELKNDGNNGKELVSEMIRELEGYTGPYIVESFDPRVLYALKKQAPGLARGQLCQNFMRTKDAPPHMRLLLWSMVSNLWTKPDFVAYCSAHRTALPYRLLKRFGRRMCMWTVRDEADLERCLEDGENPIFEKIDPEKVKMIAKKRRAE